MENLVTCCTQPALHAVKSLFEHEHDGEMLKQCDRCGAYWFFRFHEYRDVLTTWHTRITTEEAQRMLQTRDRNKLDLSYLGARESIKWEEGEVTITKGQPSRPFTF